MRALMPALAMLALAVFPIADASATDLPATPSTLTSVVQAAAAGDRVVLAGGDYGTWEGVARAGGRVELVPAGGASVSIGLSLNGASGFRVDGMTITGLSISGPAHDLSFASSTFTGAATVRAEQLNNANIVFDHDTFAGIDVCSTCYEGRLEVTGGSGPSGVTIANSQFGPGGDADGIQDGANGVQIVGNTFVGIRQVDSVHTDSLQLYGQSNTLVANNYFHDFSTAIMAPDGGDHETISNNIFDGDGSYPAAVQLGSQHSTQFVHNTLRNVDVYMDRKDESDDDSTNGVLRDNLLVSGTINTPAAKCSNCTVTNNMFSRASTASGANALVGPPSFVGGANPTTWAGFALTAGSKGTHAASDHTDIGINTPNVTPPPPLPNTTAQGGQAKANAIEVSWHSTPRSPRTRQLTRLVAAIAAHRPKGTRCRWTIDRRIVRHGCKVRVRFPLAGRKRVTLRVTTASDRTATHTRAIVVRHRAHRR